MLIKGDKVSVLDDAIDGVVLDVKGFEVTIETTDGFNLTFKRSELIKIENGNAMNFSFNRSQIINEKETAKPNYINKEKFFGPLYTQERQTPLLTYVMVCLNVPLKINFMFLLK